MSSKLLTEKEVAAILNVAACTLRSWRTEKKKHLGRGPRFIHVTPRCVRYRAEDVAEFLSARSKG